MIIPVAATRRQLQSKSIPAPVKGWNAKDPLQKMDTGFAPLLDNWFCESGYVRTRGGSASHATGIGTDNVESLMVYTNGSTSKMLAAGNSAIYDVSSAGAVGTAKASSLSNDRWQYINLNGFMLMVNGADGLYQYDGTNVTNQTSNITEGGGAPSSFAATNFVHIALFKRRVFYLLNNSMAFVYMDNVENKTGDASLFDLSYVAQRGGHLTTIVTWTRDGGNGMDDLIAFITSEGEALVYQGTDPGNANAWALVGRFDMAKPLARRGAIQYGSDAILMTRDGFEALSSVLPTGRTAQRKALSDNIRDAVNEAVRQYATNYGWEAVFFADKNMMLFNIPVVTNSKAHQYVVNTNTGAWSRFTGLNANCWAMYNNELYFGGSGGIVYKAEAGVADGTASIMADALTAYDYFGNQGLTKRWPQIRPIIKTDGTLPFIAELRTDFEDKGISAAPSPGTSGSTPWGSPWGSPWGVTDRINKNWVGVNGHGYAAATRLRVASNVLEARWIATDYLFERGGFA